MMWSRTALWVVIMVMVLGNPVDALENCTIHYYNTSKYYNPPLLVDMERKKLIYPDIVSGEQIVTLNSGTTVLASCAGTGNNFVNNSKSSMYITCRRSRWHHGRNKHQGESWKDLGCHKKVKPTLKSGKSCGKNSSMYYIGWDIRRNLYLRQISVCFNTELETTVFVKHTIHGRFIGARVNSQLQSFFKSGAMFSKDPDGNYKKQVKIANQTLGSSNELSRQGNHLSRGHLAPKADFVLKAEKIATFHYINAVPQWQSINGGNWKSLESSVRKMAKEREATLEVYTGTHGILKLPDVKGRPTEMLLGKKKVPVPALMWKVIHNPAEHTAVAIVMVNDVEKRPWSDSWSFSRCSIKCSDLHWINWTIPSVTEGQPFCCKVDELRFYIPEVPNLRHVRPLM